MDRDLLERLLGSEGADALSAAAAEAQPDSLAAATTLRRDHAPDMVAAAVQQIGLRSRAENKLGSWAASWWWTRAGLEQATRWPVAQWRAARLADSGVTEVADLGCGLGVDAAAAAAAGLGVVAVERDPVTARMAAANLAAAGVEVRCGDAVSEAGELLREGRAVLADPARRTTRGRTWQVEDFSPPYELVMGWLNEHGGVVKLGPGLPYVLIPGWAQASWVSESGSAVEVSLWAGTDSGLGSREAVVLPAGAHLAIDRAAVAEVGAPGRYLWEPDPALARAEGIDTVAQALRLRRLDPQIAYLTSDDWVSTPWLTGFEIVESFTWNEKALRAWVRDHDIGTLEIKKRGIDVDPAALRKRLRLKGTRAATIVITPSTTQTQVLVVQRLGEKNFSAPVDLWSAGSSSIQEKV